MHKIGLRILGCLDPDGRPSRDEPQPDPAAGELRLWDRRDGRLGVEGYLEPDHRAAVRSLIEQLAVPRPALAGILIRAPPGNATPTPCSKFGGLARAAQDCPAPLASPRT
ncbi:MAG: hypothetical protein WA731_06790 [Pseudonocardiaceae bacterium]|jgi:hypothetical protein|nr:hypothetical protein [Pseudonocardiaceae bacterium]